MGRVNGSKLADAWVTCPICQRPNRALTPKGRVTTHDDHRKPWTGPLSQRCEASGVLYEDLQQLGLV